VLAAPPPPLTLARLKRRKQASHNKFIATSSLALAIRRAGGQTRAPTIKP